MMLTKLVNNIISKIKGKQYAIDYRISSSYLLLLLCVRVLMFLRGKSSFIRNQGMLFIGKSVSVRAKRLISFGKGISIDDGCFIDALSSEGIVFGNNVSLGKRTVIECSGSLRHLGVGLVVGDDVGLGRDCYYGCAGGIRIGSDTIIGNFVSFHSENHNSSHIEIPIRLQGVNHKGIIIGSNCWFGAKVTVLDGAIVQDGCIFAAGSIVTAGIYQENGIYGGVPAKLIRIRK